MVYILNVLQKKTNGRCFIMMEVIVQALNKLIEENPKIVITLLSLLGLSIIIPFILNMIN